MKAPPKAYLNTKIDLSLRAAISMAAKCEKKTISTFVSEWMIKHTLVNSLAKPLSVTLDDKKDN